MAPAFRFQYTSFPLGTTASLVGEHYASMSPPSGFPHPLVPTADWVTSQRSCMPMKGAGAAPHVSGMSTCGLARHCAWWSRARSPALRVSQRRGGVARECQRGPQPAGHRARRGGSGPRRLRGRRPHPHAQMCVSATRMSCSGWRENAREGRPIRQHLPWEDTPTTFDRAGTFRYSCLQHLLDTMQVQSS